MSLLSYFAPNWGLEPPRSLLDQHFGLPITTDDLLIGPDFSEEYSHFAGVLRDVGSTLKVEKDKLQINLDVQHFSPEEIFVKADDGQIIVEGKHEEKQDPHGYIFRHFVRKYALPKGTFPEFVESKLSSDGVLTITAPRNCREPIDERDVPITQTGPIRKQIKNDIKTKDQRILV